MTDLSDQVSVNVNGTLIWTDSNYDGRESSMYFPIRGIDIAWSDGVNHYFTLDIDDRYSG